MMRSSDRNLRCGGGVRALLLVAGLAVTVFPFRAAGGEHAAPPNVLLVITDDESWLERSAYGMSKLPTPNFDRVAREGILFTHGYTSAPSCAPSRASLLTGRNFWELEQGAFIQAWLPGKFPVFPDLLAAGGYYVGRTGKGWGPGIYPEGAHGNDSAGKIHDSKKVAEPQKGISEIDYAANFGDFLGRRKAGQPFYFWVGMTEPHGPCDRKNHERLEKEYGLSTEDIFMPGFLPDTPYLRRQRGDMWYEVCYTDRQLGRILEILKAQKDWGNTLVIVTSDNGTAIQRSKATLYDWGVHEPLAVMWPTRAKGGRIVEDFVKFSDFAPTILEAAGVPVPAEMSGKSFLDILTGGKSGWVDPERDAVVTGLEWHGEFEPDNRAGRAIRDRSCQYIVHYGKPPLVEREEGPVLPDGDFEKSAETCTLAQLLSRHPRHPQVAPFVDALMVAPPEEELFDLEKDPWQMHNIIDDPSYAEVRDRLKARLHSYQEETGDPRVTRKMEIFEATRRFVQERKDKGYHE